ncbi:MAG: hypothetical protein C5B58_01975 [Acidobacteria bacterium]|nr:MAG: hypothetical protein C5B58_01975 [Acidobacteriota bacterium]
MSPSPDTAIDDRIEIAKIFAQQFNHFEWEYLCSYQWFLTAVDQALETGNFAQLTARAEKTLVDEKIRPHHAKKDSTHFASWTG